MAITGENERITKASAAAPLPVLLSGDNYLVKCSTFGEEKDKGTFHGGGGAAVMMMMMIPSSFGVCVHSHFALLSYST